MKARRRVVLDTNTLISGVLLHGSVPGQAVRKAITEDLILMSENSLFELADVLSRKKFDRYLRVEDREEFVRLVLRVTEMVPIVTAVHACRDKSDNRILEVAVNGNAALIVSGDQDLLMLNPFRGIPVLKPGEYARDTHDTDDTTRASGKPE
ncbi:MAG: putative toxin-antitoxin system toxin component, PIN family [Nitrospira sp.]|nr:putative toxin-antitoxin system toxin component, PIN family [Nitrospira sp.]MDR4464264.1 putative toxin-antitoxin system toxin component, PIN family [Nitrospira sp.]MDR4466582.1 putative toxin-antitoxin system toxin component, PIN family [Nitrospira sp.]